MHILDKLNQQINKLHIDIKRLKQEKKELELQILKLQDYNDKLKYNNENMLLQIDKVLNNSKVDNNNDISY